MLGAIVIATQPGMVAVRLDILPDRLLEFHLRELMVEWPRVA